MSRTSDKNPTCQNSPWQNPHDEDELFFEMMRDEFSFFYALTVAVMDMIKSARDRDQQDEAD